MSMYIETRFSVYWNDSHHYMPSDMVLLFGFAEKFPIFLTMSKESATSRGVHLDHL